MSSEVSVAATAAAIKPAPSPVKTNYVVLCGGALKPSAVFDSADDAWAHIRTLWNANYKSTLTYDMLCTVLPIETATP